MHRVKELVQDCIAIQQLVCDLNIGGHFPILGCLPLHILARYIQQEVSYLTWMAQWLSTCIQLRG